MKEKSREIEATRQLLEGKRKLIRKLNYRQVATLKHALDHPNYFYTIEGYKNSHGIYYDTARRDLLALSEKYGFLNKQKVGRTFVFESPPDLKKRISKIN